MKKKNVIETFIGSFKTDKKRLPTSEEICDNIDDLISLDIIESVLTDIEIKSNEPLFNTSEA